MFTKEEETTSPNVDKLVKFCSSAATAGTLSSRLFLSAVAEALQDPHREVEA